MENSFLLSLDLSTSCTGYAVFDINTKQLIDFRKIKPKVKGITKMKYPEAQIMRMINISEQILEVIEQFKPYAIVIEEIAGSKNRLSQKTLDGLHFVLVYYLMGKFPFDKVFYYDVSGLAGWRTPHLNLRLSDEDKQANKEARKLNKSLPNNQKLPIIGYKHLSCRYVNHKYNLDLDCDKSPTDGDIADAISIGDAFLQFRCTEL